MITRPHYWLAVSLLVVGASLIVIIFIRPTWGIDFTGGSLFELSVTETDGDVLSRALEGPLGIQVVVQPTSSSTVLLRTTLLTQEQHQRALALLANEGLLVEELRFESVGPTIGAELRRKAITAVLIVVVVLIGYLAYTFRSASGMMAPWKFGVAAVFALLHDLLFVTALFVILGKVANVTIDTLFVTAMLALLGYSVNDTIVIFNRLKYEWQHKTMGSLIDVLNNAVRLSLIRSLNTSLTTLIVLLALLVVGDSTIHWFIVALTAGTIVGTYSSLFVAPPLLYYLARK